MMGFSLPAIEASKFSIISVVLIILLALFNNGFIGQAESQSGADDGQQSCHMREVDLCTTMALGFLQNPNGIPVTDTEVDKQCGYLKEAEECADGYATRCLSSQNQAMMEMFFGEARKVRSDFCTKGTALRDAYMQHAPCMDEAQKKFRRSCLNDFQVGFEAIHKLNMLQRIPIGCCNVMRFRQCVYKNLEGECGEDTVEFVDSVMDRLMSRIPKLFCRDFDPESRRCKQLLPAIGTKPHVGRNTSSISRLLSTYNNIP